MILLCLSADSKIGDANIDEVLLSTLKFFMPLVVDRTRKRIPQAAGGEKDQEEIGEAATTDLSIPPVGP